MSVSNGSIRLAERLAASVASHGEQHTTLSLRTIGRNPCENSSKLNWTERRLQHCLRCPSLHEMSRARPDWYRSLLWCLWLFRHRLLPLLQFPILIRNSPLALGTDWPAADNRDRYEHDRNPTLSAEPVLIARIDAFHFFPFIVFSICVTITCGAIYRSEEHTSELQSLR